MRLFRRKSVWYIDFTFEGKRIRQAVGTSKKEAQQALDVIKGKILSGKFDVQDTIPSITFEDLAKLYIPYAQANKKSWKRDITSLKNLLPVFGEQRLKDISPLDIEQYKLQRRKEITPAGVNRELALKKYMFSLAIKWKKVNRNPVKEVKLFKEKNQRLRFLSQEEIQKLIECSQPQLRPIIIVALHTGMRKGELLGLTWEDIDFKNNQIILDETKSGYSRKIDIDYKLKEYLFKLESRNTSDYVFLNKHGKPYRDVNTALRIALKKARIKNVTMHTLRHTFGAWHAMMGTPLPTIKELMGHRAIQTTMRYIHLLRKHKQQVAAIYTRRLGVLYDNNGTNLAQDLQKSQAQKHVTY